MGTSDSNSSMNTKHAVLLLGMHRSGTSALARALGEMGLWLGEGDRLLDAHPHDNPTGYWERKDIHDAHVQYLAAKGHDWNRLAGFKVSSLDDPDGMTLSGQLKAVLIGLEPHRPWLIKDPRLSVLLPFWQNLVPQHACVVAVRHPLEIAASLRHTPRGVYSTPFLLLLWQKYMTRMIADLAGRPAIFVAYQRLLDAPERGLNRLGRLLQEAGIGGLAQLDEQRAAGLFEKKLHRNRADDSSNVLSDEQQSLYDWLVAAADQNEACVAPVDRWREPDARLAEFEASADFFVERGRGLAGAEVTARLGQIEAQSQAILEQAQRIQSVLQGQLQTAQQRIEALEGKSSRLAKQRDQLKLDLASTRQVLGDTQAHVTNIETNLRQSRDDHAALAGHAGRLEQALKEMRHSWSWRLSAPLRWPGQLPSLRFPPGFERWLYGLYYRLPGLNLRRKRAIILWLHKNAPWLTRRTLSYQLYRAAKQTAASPEARDRWLKPLTADEREKMLAGLSRCPLISVVMPAYNTEPKWLAAAVGSLQAQSYPHWQLCIADDASTNPDTRRALDVLDDHRIKIVRLERNVGIAMASNAALEAAEGDYVALLDHDDELAPDALLEAAAAIDRDDADFVYTDEDKIDYDGQHVDAHFKPDYSPDLLFSCNYICHLSVIRRDLLVSAGGFRQGFDGAQDYDLFLRCLERAKTIVHIPKVLYHWRIHEKSTAAASAAKPKSWEAGRKALTEALTRRKIAGRIDLGPFPNTYCLRRELIERPLVSVIVPFKDKPELLSACFDSVFAKGGYDNIEFLAVDNRSEQEDTKELLEQLASRDSRLRALKYDAPFNYSALNNWAVKQSRGHMLLFLNNDIDAISDGWISAMLEQAQRPDVGVVGALLLYPDATVQHAGVFVGLGGVAGHSHLGAQSHHPGYFSRLHLIQDLSAVTFACAMTRRDVFDRVRGLNERDLTIAFNDVDYCLRVRELGLRVIYTPCAKLYHFESKSRGYEDTVEKQARFGSEVAYMQRRHESILSSGDPFYNPNFALDRPSFSVRSC